MITTTMINTTKGLMDPALLERKEFVTDDENECTVAVEYWLEGELVHRSVDIRLKKGLDTLMAAANLI